MGKGSGMTRGDRRRERLRGLLPRDGAVIGIDLGDEKQAVAVVDHDVRVLARKTVRVKAFRLGEALEWAVGQARAKGFASVTVACEPARAAVAAGAAAVRRAGAATGVHPAAGVAYRPPAAGLHDAQDR
jgi:transposase